MSVNHRCGHNPPICSRARATLARAIDTYERRPMCPSCGNDSLHVDPAVRRQTQARGTCLCDGASWPHRPGGVAFCIHRAKKPTEEDYIRFYKRQS